VREYLDALDEAMAAEAAKGADRPDNTPPGNPPSEPKTTSLTDPASAWTYKGQIRAEPRSRGVYQRHPTFLVRCSARGSTKSRSLSIRFH
jgi:hypothetical protein